MPLTYPVAQGLLLRPRRHGVTTITIRDDRLNHPFDKELRPGAVLRAQLAPLLPDER